MAETDKQPPEIFDRTRRRKIRKRALSRKNSQDFLHTYLAEELVDRLLLVKMPFQRCLVIGTLPKPLETYLDSQNIQITIASLEPNIGLEYCIVQCDEDRLPFADHSFDLVIGIGMLDSVNDFPGMLVLVRKILKPDGLFMAAFPGAGSLTLIKSLFMKIDENQVRPHIHPQIDVRTAGDLLTRTGFALPVADAESLTLRYQSMSALLQDIRDFGGSNALSMPIQSLNPSKFRELKIQFADQAEEDGKFSEMLEIVYFCGWAPHPDQPKPAKRGSGQISLKTALDGDNQSS